MCWFFILEIYFWGDVIGLVMFGMDFGVVLGFYCNWFGDYGVLVVWCLILLNFFCFLVFIYWFEIFFYRLDFFWGWVGLMGLSWFFVSLLMVFSIFRCFVLSVLKFLLSCLCYGYKMVIWKYSVVVVMVKFVMLISLVMKVILICWNKWVVIVCYNWFNWVLDISNDLYDV